MESTLLGTGGNVLGWHVVIAAAISFVFEWLKKARWFPWITRSSDGLNWLVGIVLAALAAAGIQLAFNPDEGTLIVSGLSLASLTAFFAEWVRQWIFQQIVFKGVVQR